MTCDSTTSAPTKCTATLHSTIHANSPKARRISRQAHTVRRKRHPTSWCAHGFARTGFAPRSPTVPTITGRTSMWKNLFRGRSLPSWRACDLKLYGTGENVRDWIHTGRPLFCGVGDSYARADRRNVPDWRRWRNEQYCRNAYDSATYGMCRRFVRLGA